MCKTGPPNPPGSIYEITPARYNEPYHTPLHLVIGEYYWWLSSYLHTWPVRNINGALDYWSTFYTNLSGTFVRQIGGRKEETQGAAPLGTDSPKLWLVENKRK